ncbi:glutathione S-transferase family protein [Pseudomonas zhanjiangensis]|uniref:Glutathione S-transferase family protein n=1 Tax=Pseudomonas zhanjiangensis TaxID=3239015 RepID=A0ABV3YTA4_9PSED
MTASNSLVLYDFANSPCVRRVKICLLEKGIPFTREIINLARMEQKSPAYLRINPNGVVPALSHNGAVIYESSVICDYLEDVFVQVPLYPDTLPERLEVRQWQNLELAMARVYRNLMYAVVMGPLNHIACDRAEFIAKAARATDNPAHLAWEAKVWNLQVLTPAQQAQHKKRLRQFATRVENALAGRDFLVGTRFGMADILIYPRLKMFPIVGVSLSAQQYPNLTRWMAALEQRHSFVESQSEEEKVLLKLRAKGVLQLICRIAYTPPARRSLGQRAVLALLRPILRRKLGINEAFTPITQRQLASTQPGATPLLGQARMHSLTSAERQALLQAADAQASGLTLYGFQHCPLTRRLLLVLRGMGVPYRYQEVDLLAGEEGLPTLLRSNPVAEVPVLQHGDRLVIDSLKIAEYLLGNEEPDSLFSSQPLALAQIRMWSAFDSGMEKEYQPFLLDHLAEQQGRLAAAAEVRAYNREQAQQILREKLQLLDDALDDRPWLVGARFSYADLLLYTRLDSFAAIGLGACLQPFQRVRAWLERCATHVQQWQSPRELSAVDAGVEA